MASRKALITWGGWEGHEPRQVGEVFKAMLEDEGFADLSRELIAVESIPEAASPEEHVEPPREVAPVIVERAAEPDDVEFGE